MAASISTKIKGSNYDAMRKHGGISGDLILRTDTAAVLATITGGWAPIQTSFEDVGGGQVISLRVADLDETDYSTAVFFDWDGIRYERDEPPTKPTMNPKEWIWRVKPVGAIA